MGHYTGNGVVTGGGHNVRVFGSLVYNGVHMVYQRTISTETVRSGVSLATAQAESSSLSLSSHIFSWANLYPWVGCKGSQKDVSYSQIAGSNLYELRISEKSLAVSDDGSSWNT